MSLQPHRGRVRYASPMFRRVILILLVACGALWTQEQQQAFKIQPLRPVPELRAAAMAAQPPTEPGPFRQPDLADLM
jgi:hypothetical protein